MQNFPKDQVIEPSLEAYKAELDLVLSPDLTSHSEIFFEHIHKVCVFPLPDPLLLKVKHTLKVVSLAVDISKAEGFASQKDLFRICRLAALYHDLARFDQFTKYETFRDADSKNHGLWAVQILKNRQILAEESLENRKAIYTAIALHNRFAIPQNLPKIYNIALCLVRDCDKLDILRIMAEELCHKKVIDRSVVLGVKDSETIYSEAVINSAMNNKVAAYRDLKSVNDFRLLLATWLYDLNFSASKEQFLQENYSTELLNSLPDNAIYGKVKAKLKHDFAIMRKHGEYQRA